METKLSMPVTSLGHVMPLPARLAELLQGNHLVLLQGLVTFDSVSHYGDAISTQGNHHPLALCFLLEKALWLYAAVSLTRF